MGFRKFLLLCLLILSFTVLISCSGSDSDPYEGMVKVVFEMEGGTYQNCTLPAIYYYDFEPGTGNRIVNPSALSSKSTVTRSGYTLSGWYRTRTVNADGSVSYSDPWDFETDLVYDAGITLYAGWEKNVRYTYQVCYEDETGALLPLGEYEVKAGQAFSDYKKYAQSRSGYTAIGYTDKDGNPWDSTYCHPGGDTDVAVPVLVQYIEGSYKVVSTPSELKTAINSNIYLANDIDFGGSTFSGFGNYTHVLLGNGHTISNFSLSYTNTLGETDADIDPEGNLLLLSVFRSLSGATVQDVSFRNVTIDINVGDTRIKKIFVAPLSLKISDSTVTGVSFEGVFRCTNLPDKESVQESYWQGDPERSLESHLIVIPDQPFYYRPENDTSDIACELAIDNQIGTYFIRTEE